MFDPKFHFGLLVVVLCISFLVSAVKVGADKDLIGLTITLAIFLYLIGFGIRIMCAGL